MPEHKSTDSQTQRQAIEQAVAAARDGDARGMLAAMHASGVLDGLVRRFCVRWPRLGRDEIDFIVAEAVDVLFEKVRSGDRVLNPIGFLWKVCDRSATDRRQMRQRERLAEAGVLDGRSEHGRGNGIVAKDPDADWDERRRRAIQLARSLLPRLGQQNLQDVMAYVIGAVEAGRDDVPSAEIAESLGLTPGTVRTSLSRGFDRLKRIARDEHLIDQDIDLTPFEVSGDVEEEADEGTQDHD